MKYLALKHAFVENKKSTISNEISIFSDLKSTLGESPLWHTERSSLFWLDILKKRLYEKNIHSSGECYWDLPITASSIAKDLYCKDELWMITSDGLCKLSLVSNSLVKIKSFNLENGYRTNDGGISPDGRYWFGTMLCEPKDGYGDVYSIGKENDLRLELSSIAIPNTFCWTSFNSLLLTDSLKKICNLHILKSNTIISKEAFLDLSNTNGTPDGGAIDKNGNIWIAIWGEGKVVCVSKAGDIIRTLEIPALQPSSCCFGGDGNNILFITTATEGLSEEQLALSPNSGKIFSIELEVEGKEISSFYMENVC